MGEPLPMGHLQSAIQGPAKMGRDKKREKTVTWTWLAFSKVLCAATPGECAGRDAEALPSPLSFRRRGPGDQRTADC